MARLLRCKAENSKKLPTVPPDEKLAKSLLVVALCRCYGWRVWFPFGLRTAARIKRSMTSCQLFKFSSSKEDVCKGSALLFRSSTSRGQETVFLQLPRILAS